MECEHVTSPFYHFLKPAEFPVCTQNSQMPCGYAQGTYEQLDCSIYTVKQGALFSVQIDC